MSAPEVGDVSRETPEEPVASEPHDAAGDAEHRIEGAEVGDVSRETSAMLVDTDGTRTILSTGDAQPVTVVDDTDDDQEATR